MHYFMSFLVLQLSWREEKAGFFALLSFGCLVTVNVYTTDFIQGYLGVVVNISGLLPCLHSVALWMQYILAAFLTTSPVHFTCW